MTFSWYFNLRQNTRKYTKNFKYISIHTRKQLNKYTHIHDTRNWGLSHISGTYRHIIAEQRERLTYIACSLCKSAKSEGFWSCSEWPPVPLLYSLGCTAKQPNGQYKHRRSVKKKTGGANEKNGVPMLNESYYNLTNELYLEIKWYKVSYYRRVSLQHFVLANISMICQVESDFVML